MTHRLGSELWRQLDFTTGKRIKSQWKDVQKLVRLLTSANNRKSLGMSGEEIDRLAQYIHNINKTGLGMEETM